MGADGRARRGWPRALDRVPDRPVAGGLRQLPDGDCGHTIAASRRPSGLGPASTADMSRGPCQSETFGPSVPQPDPYGLHMEDAKGIAELVGDALTDAGFQDDVRDARRCWLVAGAKGLRASTMARTHDGDGGIWSRFEAGRPRWRWSCCRLTDRSGCMPNRPNERPGQSPS